MLCRDINTLEVLPEGEVGVIQLFSTLPRSYPGHSLLTEDIGRVYSGTKCNCSKKGSILDIHGRAVEAEVRVVAMPIVSADDFEFGSWKPQFKFGASHWCEDQLLYEFINKLSSAISINKAARDFPDLMTFAFATRKSQLSRYISLFSSQERRRGWEVVHIPGTYL